MLYGPRQYTEILSIPPLPKMLYAPVSWTASTYRPMIVPSFLTADLKWSFG